MSYNHMITIVDKQKRLEIYRLFPDGRKELYTSIDLPANNKEQLSNFARAIGEALLLDSPVARRILKL